MEVRAEAGRWDAIRSSTTPVSYTIAIQHLNYKAEIPAFLPQRTFYESFIKTGAHDCGNVPNNRF